MRNILIVGAGFAGAIHARELAEAGYNVDVIDKRNHIGGNCFDYIHDCGVRVHKYGPHLFHTSNNRVVDWLSRFTSWVPYEHNVVAILNDGSTCPLPINLDTVNIVFKQNFDTPEEVVNFLKTKSISIESINSAEDHLLAHIGPELTDLFFRPYTRKMWGMELSEVDSEVVKRLKIRPDRNPRYFHNDTFQSMPSDGYTRLFESIFNHSRIKVHVNKEFIKAMLKDYDFCFNSMPIDDFYDYEFGELPYRSIRFHLNECPISQASKHAVVNYTDSTPFTRETWWHNIAGHWSKDTGRLLRTVEEPCDYRENGFERYYPIKTTDNRYENLYKKYLEGSKRENNICFIGRCGTYQYLDMHQVINQSLMNVANWIEKWK
ncbi:FAD-dependent oxidoreductase [Methylobacterium mesophilicum]